MKVDYTELRKEDGTRISKAIIEYKDKIYTGIARCHKEDTWSNFFGYRLAETRAYIKILKDRFKDKKIEYKAIGNFIKSIESYKTFDNKSDIAKSMYKQLNIKKKELDNLKIKIDLLKKQINKNIEERDRFLTKISKK